MSTTLCDEVLPLVPNPTPLDKSNSVTWKLSMNPGTAGAGTYEVVQQVITGDEPLREGLVWRATMPKIFKGMGAEGNNNAAEADAREELIVRALKGSALAAFHAGLTTSRDAMWEAARIAARTAAAQAQGATAQTVSAAYNNAARPDHSNAEIEAGMNHVIESMSPYKALARVKRWARRKCRKPADMTIRAFYGHLVRINTEEIPLMPPLFDNTQSITDDELTEIMLYAIPNSWKKHLDVQGKDPDTMRSYQFLILLEQFEAAEKAESSKNNISSFTPAEENSKGKKKKKYSGKSMKKGHQKGNGKKFCLHHGQNETHTTNECKVLKSMSESIQKGGDNKNKTWKRNKDGEKKDLKCFTEDASKDPPKESTLKKRKVIVDSDDEEGELRNFEFDQMADLKLSDDDNTAVSEASA